MNRRKLTKEQRRKIYGKTHGRCAYCGCELRLDEMAVDHVMAVMRGGGNGEDNLLPACRSCNHYKSAMTVEDFRGQIGKWLDRLTRDGVTYKNAVRFGLVIPNPHEIKFYYEKLNQEGE